MAQKRRGLYREPGLAHVTDDSGASEIPEQEYRQRGYEPDYDELPIREEYDSITEGGA